MKKIYYLYKQIDMCSEKDNIVYEKGGVWQVTGKMDGQALWFNLLPDEKKMSTSWCRSSGYGNTARRQQLKQMLARYLATNFPKTKGQIYESLNTRVKWKGDIDTTGKVTFIVNSKYESACDDCNRLTRILKHERDQTKSLMRQKIRDERKLREEKHAEAVAQAKVRAKQIRKKTIRDLNEKGAQIMAKYESQGLTGEELARKKASSRSIFDRN